MCDHNLQMSSLNMQASCENCDLVLDIDELLMYAEKGLKAAQQSVHPTGGGLCAVCGKSADHHEDHDYVAPLTAPRG